VHIAQGEPARITAHLQLHLLLMAAAEHARCAPPFQTDPDTGDSVFHEIRHAVDRSYRARLDELAVRHVCAPRSSAYLLQMIRTQGHAALLGCFFVPE
jgi:hypothetical protein